MEHLKEVLEYIFGPFDSLRKEAIIEAVNKDNKVGAKLPLKVAEILPMFNEVFQKRSRVVSKKVINRYKEILKVYSLEEINIAMINAKNDDFHKETGYKHCTLEYFSRMEQMDKWFSFNPKQTTIFTMPKMNLKK